MLASPASPLRVSWRDLPMLAPWLLRFLAQARPARVRTSTATLASLCVEAMDGFWPITEGRPAQELMRPTGWATVFKSAAGRAAARPGIELRDRHGWRAQWLEGDALRERIPGLSPQVIAAAVFPDIWMCADPCGFVERLADDVRTEGGRIDAARVTALRPRADGVAVETGAGSVDADHVVIAAGVGSRAIAATLGDALPLVAERGYHAMLRETDGAPPMPIMSGEHHFVTTPMAHGVRLAGTSEFARVDRPPDPRRAALLIEHARTLFPDLRTADHATWMGSRSTTPDSLPIIGRSPRHATVTYACGHQHLGLTLSGVTGRLVADDLAGRAARLDTAPLRVDRF